MVKNILGFFGFFLIFISGCLAVPMLIALVYGETHCALAFLITIAIALIPGIILRHTAGRSFAENNLKLRYSFLLVSVSWIIASALAAVPFVISGSIPDPIEAFFETCSGFTTTGSTILTDIESLPKSMLFWRSLTQWLGGMGIIVLFVAILPNFGIKARNIAGAETPGPTITKISARFSETARLLYIAYIVLSVVLVVLLMFGGVSLYDAVCHAMTTMATGGYSTYNEGVSHFNNKYIYWVFTIFMILAGTNFNLFFLVIRGRIREAFKDDELRLYFIIVGISTVLITTSLMLQGDYEDFGTALTDSAFQVATVISTTGYATANYVTWPIFCQMILLILMFTGASSSSTAGGIKQIRILIFFRMIRYELRRLLHSNIVADIRYNGKKMMPDTLTNIMTFITTYIITLTMGTLIITLTGDGNIYTNFTAVLTCISNVGPGFDLVGPVCNFHFYSWISKLILSLIMVAGRLELVTFFIVFTKHFWRPERI